MCDICYACFEIGTKWDRRARGLVGFSDDCSGDFVDCGWDGYGMG
jgi:hypothetical protein